MGIIKIMREFETEIKTDDGVMDVFVCHPEQDGPHPAVILYMDAPGIREELRDMARRMGSTTAPGGRGIAAMTWPASGTRRESGPRCSKS